MKVIAPYNFALQVLALQEKVGIPHRCWHFRRVPPPKVLALQEKVGIPPNRVGMPLSVEWYNVVVLDTCTAGSIILPMNSGKQFNPLV